MVWQWSFTHRHVEFVECVPKWCMRSHIQRFIKPPHRNRFEHTKNSSIKICSQTNDADRKKKYLAQYRMDSISIEVSLDFSSPHNYEDDWILSLCERWTRLKFNRSQSRNSWNCTHHTVTKITLNCSAPQLTLACNGENFFFLVNYHLEVTDSHNEIDGDFELILKCIQIQNAKTTFYPISGVD